MQTLIVAVVAGIALVASLIADHRKTLAALRIAGKRFLSLLPSFLTMLAAVSLLLGFVSREVIVEYLGSSRPWQATGIAAALGSVFLMPGFVAFPLAGILVDQGVARMVVAAFTTSLMLVGVLTYPIERQYFGTAVTILRNVLSLIVSIAICIAVGLLYREIA